MSAREDLYMELMWDNTPEGEARANALIDAFAHELAEKIRALGTTEWEGMNESVRMLRKMRAQAADLIDPEVSSG